MPSHRYLDPANLTSAQGDFWASTNIRKLQNELKLALQHQHSFCKGTGPNLYEWNLRIAKHKYQCYFNIDSTLLIFYRISSSNCFFITTNHEFYQLRNYYFDDVERDQHWNVGFSVWKGSILRVCFAKEHKVGELDLSTRSSLFLVRDLHF